MIDTSTLLPVIKPTRKKPWNRVNLPVYSISSKANGKANMHIITYVTPISMQPKRYVCSIYHGTQTLENVITTQRFVLQLLGEQQYRLVELLGKQSGRKVDKMQWLHKRQLLITWRDFDVLTDALAVIELQVIDTFEGGDHTGFICDVTGYKNLNEGTPLTLDKLRAHKLIRI
jgi:flavin reductase (DIM6/NTAB) family NADH-FMN oxidoreductase RutF